MTEATLSRHAVYVARPVLRVDEEEHPEVNELLIGMELLEAEGRLASLQLRFSNIASRPRGGSGPAFEDERIIRLGSQIAVYGGDINAPRELFRGIVTGIEGEFPETSPPELIVFAEDALQRARMKRRTVLHDDLSVADLARSLANELGLNPVVTGLTENIGSWMQLNESDLAFMHRILCRYDGDMQVVGDELHVSPRGDVRRGTLFLELYSQLRSARVRADLAHQNTEVTVGGWDVAAGRRVSGSGTGVDLGPGRGRTGGQVLSDAIGERTEHLGNAAVATEAEAGALADAVFDRDARRFLCVDAVADGNPRLRVGTHVTLSGISSRFDNTYYVTQTCHRFDVNRGYETHFEAESAYLGFA